MAQHRGALPAATNALFAITVVFEILPQHLTSFLGHMHENAQASVEHEEGCLRFDVLRPLRPEGNSTVFLYEVYRSRAAFDAHLASAHFQRFDAATQSMIGSKSVETYAAWENSKAAPHAQSASALST